MIISLVHRYVTVPAGKGCDRQHISALFAGQSATDAKGPAAIRLKPGGAIRSQSVAAEGIAAFDRPVGETRREPALALRGGAVGEGIGHDIALRFPL